MREIKLQCHNDNFILRVSVKLWTKFVVLGFSSSG